MFNYKKLKDKRIRLYELADLEDMDNLIDMKFTELSIQVIKINQLFLDMQSLIVQRRTEEYLFLTGEKKKQTLRDKQKASK